MTPTELRQAAETALRRAMPLDSWFLHVSVPQPGVVRVDGLARTPRTEGRAHGALRELPGVRRVETALRDTLAWPRSE